MANNPKKPLKYRSQAWFDNPANADMTALYLERYLNYGFTRAELQGGKPIIGIAQTGSRPLALQPRPHRPREARARRHRRGGRHSLRIPHPPDPGNRQAPDRLAGPQPLLSLASSRCSTAIRWTAWC